MMHGARPHEKTRATRAAALDRCLDYSGAAVVPIGELMDDEEIHRAFEDERDAAHERDVARFEGYGGSGIDRE